MLTCSWLDPHEQAWIKSNTVYMIIKMHLNLKMSSAIFWPFCSSLIVLIWVDPNQLSIPSYLLILCLPYGIDCYTALAWWPWNWQWGMGVWGMVSTWLTSPIVIGWSKYGLGMPRVTVHYGTMWLVSISIVFQRPLAVPLHIPNNRQMPAIRAVQGDCENIYLWG